MLIGKSGDAQTVLLRTFGNAHPVDMHRDVSMPDLFEWRIEISMSRPYLKVSLKFALRTPVIDGYDIPAFQIRRELVDPGKRSVIKCLIIDLALDENKLVAVKTNKLLPAVSDKPHGHRIEQFVGKMNTRKWLQRIATTQSSREMVAVCAFAVLAKPEMARGFDSVKPQRIPVRIFARNGERQTQTARHARLVPLS